MDEEGVPVFMPHVEEWMKNMRTKLLEWSARLLAQACALPLAIHFCLSPCNTH